MSYNLYNSTLCRLCAEPNTNGISLSAVDGEGISNYELINKYLPLKVEDNGKLPRTLCGGCHNHLRNTVCFFGLLIKGQTLLQKLYKLILSKEQVGGVPVDIPKTLFFTGDVNEKLYDDSHSIRAQADVVEVQPPRRKRGRPRKDEAKALTNTSEADCPPDVEAHPVAQPLEPIDERDEDELPTDGKRRRKKPLRYLESIQGKELEKILHENGVADDGLPQKEDESGEPGEIEVIGLVQNSKGESIGQVVMCKRLADSQIKKKFQFRCDVCHSVFSQESKFVEHVARHNDLKMKCSQCDEVFDSSKDLKRHSSETGHDNTSDPMPLDGETEDIDPGGQPCTGGQDVVEKVKSTCPICQKTFKFALSLKTHMKAEHDDVAGVYPCDICGKKLKYMSSVVYHKETEHVIGTKFVCSKCNMTFKHRRLLQKHQYVHGENGKVDRQGNPILNERSQGLNCPDCGKYLKSKAYLKIHVRLHGNNKNYVCEICNTSYQHRSALMLHRRLHTEEKPFQCYFCNKMFSQKGNLNEHMRIHTGEKPFQCEICDRIFATSSQRRIHLKRHIGEKPFECEICQKAFLHKDSLISHMRRHTGERPYQCEKCKKTFTELSAVRKHVRIHTGEKPFVCSMCGKAFADSSNLSKHKKTHSKASSDAGLLVSDILPDGLTVSDLPLVDSSDEKQFWAVVKQTSESQDDKDLDQQQVIYITYNDPDDPNSKVSEALIVNKEAVGDKEEDEVIAGESQEENIANRGLMAVTNDINTNSPSLSPTSSHQGLQGMTPLEGQVVMDEHGYPLRFTTADGGIFQVTTIDGESLQLTGSDGSSMPVRITTADGETLTPAGLNISSMVGDVVEDPLVSAAVESLELVSTADVRLLSEAALDFLPLS